MKKLTIKQIKAELEAVVRDLHVYRFSHWYYVQCSKSGRPRILGSGLTKKQAFLESYKVAFRLGYNIKTYRVTYK